MMNCMTCGHSGERISDVRGFCTQCGNLPSRRPAPVGKLTVNCLRCGTEREHDADCAVCAAGSGGAPSPTVEWMPLAWSYTIAAIVTIIGWLVVFIVGAAGTFVVELSTYSSRTPPVATPFAFNAFTTGLAVGGVVATAIVWFLARKRHPFIGAFSGGFAGMLATCAWWLLG